MRALALLALLAAARAEAAPVEDGQIWVNVNAQGSIKDRLLYYAEVQPRFFDGGGEVGQVIVRPAIGWKLSEKLSVFQGYAHVANPGDFNEERSFQQLSWTPGKIAGGRFSSRTRFEQRWRSDGSDVAFRLRTLFRWAHPLGRDEKGLAAVVSAEPFVALNDTDWGGKARFDQLRSNAALEIPLRGKTTLEVGYLNQWVHRLGQPDQVNHIAQIVLSLRP
jgi:hypothetical protein